MNRLISAVIVSILLVTVAVHCAVAGNKGKPAAKAADLIFVCEPGNDIYRVAVKSGKRYARFDNALKAAKSAAAGAAILILADGYPDSRTVVPEEVFSVAAKKKIRLYIEFPQSVPGMKLGEVQHVRRERGVVTSDVFSPELKPMRIVMFHDAVFISAEARNPMLSIAQVAGFDTAVFGLKDTKSWPILFEQPDTGTIIATTKLSRFQTGRYAPTDAWPVIWKKILRRLQPGRRVPDIKWIPEVRPSYARERKLPAGAQLEAVRRGTEWYGNARLLVHPDWASGMEKAASYNDRVGPGAPKNSPVGDGSLGLLEGFSSSIAYDGSQPVRWYRRADCNGETAMAFATRSLADSDPQSRKISENLLDFIFTKSVLQQGPRANRSKGSYGLLGWDDTPRSTEIYYGDDNARALLGAVAVSGVLDSDRWDEPIIKAVLGNFRTSGAYGFRHRLLEELYISLAGWTYLWAEKHTDYSPHFQSWLWACYLWMYDKTGFKPLLDRSKTGIRMMMEAYPGEWHWTNGIQQERARMLLPLAWLIRVEDTPEHRAWLSRIAGDLLSYQDASGAIREEIGSSGKGDYGPPRSNDAYGTTEAPLIQQNGDPLSDLLYTTNFAFIGLHEAARATGDKKLAAAEDRLADFLIRIQVRSETHPELDGAWFRAFDYKRWDYWASNSDLGWGAWSIETGWTQGWIVSTLALRQKNTGLWEIASGKSINTNFDAIRKKMIPDKMLK